MRLMLASSLVPSSSLFSGPDALVEMLGVAQAAETRRLGPTAPGNGRLSHLTQAQNRAWSVPE